MEVRESLAEGLLGYLRGVLGAPGLGYAAPPVRLHGGFETAIYRFALDGAPADWSGPLVVRIFPRMFGAERAAWESTVQGVLADNGYPVARPYAVCTDSSVLGGAFFIMDHLAGQPLMAAPVDTVPATLGRVHADLHRLDPAPLMAALEEQGIPERRYALAGWSASLRNRTADLDWIAPCVDWLVANRPGEPAQRVVCHGDFHPLNILYAGGRVTGVLDWSGFAIADPAFDVGNTLMLIKIGVKNLSASMDGLASVDWDGFADAYLAAYRARRPLEVANLAYYEVRRCIYALIEGHEGQQVWQHPGIVRDLLARIREVTGVRVCRPEGTARVIR